MRKNNFTVYIEQDEDGVFIGSLPAIPGCHAEGRTQKEMLENLKQVLKLCLRNMKGRDVNKTKFVGIQNMEVIHA